MYGYTKIRSHACACMSDNARARAHTHTGPLLDPVVMMLALSTVTGFMAGRFCATPEGRALVRLYPLHIPPCPHLSLQSEYWLSRFSVDIWEEERQDALEYSQARTHRCSKGRRR